MHFTQGPADYRMACAGLGIGALERGVDISKFAVGGAKTRRRAVCGFIIGFRCISLLVLFVLFALGMWMMGVWVRGLAAPAVGGVRGPVWVVGWGPLLRKPSSIYTLTESSSLW